MEARCPEIDGQWRRRQGWLDRHMEEQQRRYEARRPGMEDTVEQNQEWISQELET